MKQLLQRVSSLNTRRLDPRYYQIGSLLLLLLFGLTRLGFDLRFAQTIVILATVFLVQHACGRVWRLPHFDPKSALISGLSLCLLARTNSLTLSALVAGIAISSKFLLRFNGKHIFNPTNFGIVIMLLCARGKVWVSPGQWGDFAFFAFLVLCLGGLVVMRASRADVSLAFLSCYLGLVFARSLWLGEPLSIPLHRFQNGALLIFSFFMISDPKTTPNSRIGRIIFAVLVAFGAAYVQFKLFRPNGLLWSLAVFSLLVPVLDRLFPGQGYRWESGPVQPQTNNTLETLKGNVYDPIRA